MAKLAESLDQIRRATPASTADSVHNEFEARRRQLNEHAARINTVRAPAGLSVIQILGRLLRLPEAARSSVRLRGAALSSLDRGRFDELRRSLMDAAAHSALFSGDDASPWN